MSFEVEFAIFRTTLAGPMRPGCDLGSGRGGGGCCCPDVPVLLKSSALVSGAGARALVLTGRFRLCRDIVECQTHNHETAHDECPHCAFHCCSVHRFAIRLPPPPPPSPPPPPPPPKARRVVRVWRGWPLRLIIRHPPDTDAPLKSERSDCGKGGRFLPINFFDCSRSESDVKTFEVKL